MEKLIINTPDTKSNQVLKLPVKGNYQQKLVNVSEWSEDDVKPLLLLHIQPNATTH